MLPIFQTLLTSIDWLLLIPIRSFPFIFIKYVFNNSAQSQSMPEKNKKPVCNVTPGKIDQLSIDVRWNARFYSTQNCVKFS